MKKDKPAKKKKSLLKRLLKWTGITFLFLLILIILLPILFKDNIIEFIKKEANSSLNAKLEFGEVSLSLLSTFPSFGLEINDLTLTGVDEFENLALADIKQTKVKLDLWSVVSGDQYSVSSIGLIEPKIHIKVLENGKANYDIAKTDSTAVEEDSAEEATSIKLSLEEYYIENSTVIYDDESLVTYVELSGLNHRGDAVIDGTTYTVKTVSDIEELTLGYDEVDYLSEAISDIKCDLEIDMPESEMKISFLENEAIINELGLSFEGWLLMKDDLMDMDFSFATTRQTFKSLLSMVPGVYSPDFGEIKTDGALELKGKVYGEYSDNSMPGFDLMMKVKNAWFQYPGLPSKMENINIDVAVDREPALDFNNTKVDVSKFHLEFSENELDASLKLKNLMVDPHMDCNIKTLMDLAKLKDVMPMDEGEEYNGVITSNIELKGYSSSLEKEEYDKFHAAGELSVKEMVYKSLGMNYSTAIDSMRFLFTPENLRLANFDAKIGASDIHADGDIDNYLQYFLKDDVLSGNFNVSSGYLNVDELMFTEEVPSEQLTESEGEVAEVEVADEVMSIPDNINFRLNTQVDKVLYDSLEMNNMKGTFVLNEGKASMEDITIGVFEGSIGFSGSYEAVAKDRSKVDMDLNVKNLDIPKSAIYFNTIEKLVPIAKYCKGNFSTNLTMVSELTPMMEPIYESLTGKGKVRTKKVVVNNFPALNKLAETLKIKELESQTVENLNIAYSFRDGRIWVEPYNIKLNKIDTEIEGSTSFKQDLDYTMKMNIPSNILGNEAADMFASALSSAEDVGIKLGDNIPVNVKVGGTATKPKISTDLKNQGQNLVEDIIDQGKEKLFEEAQRILDQAQEQADKLIAEAKEKAGAIRKVGKESAEKVRKEGKAAAEKVRKEGESASELVKKEGYAQAEKLIDEANNPIAKIAAEKAAEKVREETDKKAAAVLAESNKKADKLEEDSESKAKKIEDESEAKASGIENTAQNQADEIMENARTKSEKIKE